MDTTKDRRQYHRFTAIDNIITINPMFFGQVIDLSMGGLRIKYLLRPDDPFQDSLEISLLNNDGDRYVDKLACQVVSFSDSAPIAPPLNLFTRETGVMFSDLSSSQMYQLSDFVLHTIFSLEKRDSN